MSVYELLKPCPFCGGDALLDSQQGYISYDSRNHGTAIAVYCAVCSASVLTCREDVPDITPQQVIEQWNKRVP